MMQRNRFTKLAAGIAVAFASSSAMADSVVDAAAPWSAAVNHDFTIVIPAFLYFRVGTNVSGTINNITFTATTANVGNTTPIAGAGGEAAAGGSAANVQVRANVGQITITESNNSGGNGLGNGTAADGYIPYTQISTSSSDIANLPAPALSNAGGTAALVALNAGSTKVTDRTAVWTYSYLNASVPAAGTYGAGGTGTGGRVTYTATAP